MSDQQRQASVADPQHSAEHKYRVEAEARLIESVRSSNLTERLAESRVAYKSVAETLLKVEDDLKEREHQRQIANEALEVALNCVRGAHLKSAPSHKALDHARCKTCIMIRTLNRQLVRSARPTSRMALAS